MKRVLALFIVSAMFVSSAPATLAANQETEKPHSKIYKDNFVITAYYSPKEKQERYMRGSYESDMRLNGRGKNAADGTAVYYGMIAASKDIPFGSKVYIPGLGLMTVHDRGSAITKNRLDVWMGPGEDGLARAIKWGKKAREATVYLPGANIPDNVLSQKPKDSFFYEHTSKDQILARLPKTNEINLQNLKYGKENEQIKRIQKKMQKLGYYNKQPNGKYDHAFYRAVFAMQKAKGVVESMGDYGAGYFGPKTLALYKNLKAKMSVPKAMAKEQEAKEIKKNSKPKALALKEDKDIIQIQKSNVAMTTISGSKSTELTKEYPKLDETFAIGARNKHVKTLHQGLLELGYLDTMPSDPVHYSLHTSKAVFAFQKGAGILQKDTDFGAGTFGPKTKKAFNEKMYETKVEPIMLSSMEGSVDKKEINAS